MEILAEILGGLIEEALLELGFRALCRLPGSVSELRSRDVQTLFARHSLD